MDTWGISGPAFLAVDGGILAVTAALVAASRLRHPPGRGTTKTEADLDDYDVAVLNGEPGLPVAVALLALDRAGAVALGDRMVHELAETNDIEVAALTESRLAGYGSQMEVLLTGELPPGAHPVEAAVYGAVVDSSSRQVHDIRRAAARLPAVEAVRTRLVGLGLLADPTEQDRRRRQWVWFTPVALLAVARLWAGGANGKPVLYLLLLLAVTAGAMLVTRRTRHEVRTRMGDRLLQEARTTVRTRHRDGASDGLAAPEGWGRARTGRILALNGARELWAKDRSLALALGAGSLDLSWTELADARARGGGSGCGAGIAGFGGGCGGGCGGGGGGGGGGGCGGCGG